MSSQVSRPIVFGLSACAFLGLLLPGAASAENQPSRTFRAKVELVVIEVTAVDKKGEPVRNLTKEDFALLEDGKPRPVDSFEFVEAQPEEPLPASLEDIDEPDSKGRTVLLIFDELNMPNRAQSIVAREAAAAFVEKHFSPWDRWGVALYGRQLEVVQNFSHEKGKILAAVRRPAPAFAKPRGAEEGIDYDYIRAIDGLVGSLSEIRGRKVVIIVTEGFRVLNRFVPAYQQLFLDARKADVTFYTVDSQGGNRKDSGSLTRSEMGAGQTDRRSPSIGPGSQTAAAATDPDTHELVALPPAETKNFLQLIAEDTGGFAVRQTNDLAAGLDRIGAELRSYYVFGFRPSGPGQDGATHAIEVKLNAKGVVLRYRKNYLAPRPPDVLAGAKAERQLLEALNSPTSAKGISLQMRSLYFYEAADTATLTILAIARPVALEFKRQGDSKVGHVDLVGMVYTDGGDVAARFSESIPVIVPKDLPPNQADLVLSEGIPYQNSLRLSPGKYRIRMAAGDGKNGTGTAEEMLIVPPFTPGQLVLGSVVVSQLLVPLPTLIQDLDTQLLNRANPLVYRTYEVRAPIDRRISREKPALVFSKIYNLTEGAALQDLSMKIQLISDGGAVQVLGPLQVVELAQPTGRDEAIIRANLATESLAPGRYKLILEVFHKKSGKAEAAAESDLLVE